MTKETRALAADIVEFLQREGQMAFLATLSPGGFPHVTPMWYLYEEGSFWMWTWTTRRKYRNIVNSSEKVAFYIQSADDAHKGLMVTGTVRLHRENLEPRAERLARRYVEPEELGLWVSHILYGDTVILEIEPVSVVPNGSSWNL